MPIKEADYLYASGRIRALEAKLLTRERALRIVDARTPEEAQRLLSECDYALAGDFGLSRLEQALAAKRAWLFETVGAMLPDPRLLSYLKIRYDCHNAKVLLKASHLQLRDNGPQGDLPFQDFGTIPVGQLTLLLREGDLRSLPLAFASTIEEAQGLLARTGDSQRMEIHLDRYCLQEMLRIAEAIDSEFLVGYTRLLIDTANLRLLARLQRMENRALDRSAALDLSSALAPGGHRTQASLEQEAQNALGGQNAHPVADLERHCDNRLMHYLLPAKALAFGHPIVVAYLLAVESEIQNTRSLIAGKIAGVTAERLRERLRDTYV